MSIRTGQDTQEPLEIRVGEQEIRSAYLGSTPLWPERQLYSLASSSSGFAYSRVSLADGSHTGLGTLQHARCIAFIGTRLYGMDNSRFVEINRLAGGGTETVLFRNDQAGATPWFPTGAEISGMALHNGTLYVVAGARADSSLYSIDIDAQTVTRIGGLSAPTITDPHDLASHNGVLYLLASDSNQPGDNTHFDLFSIDTASGAATRSVEIMDEGNTLGADGGITSDGTNLYMYNRTFSIGSTTFSNGLSTINLSTGSYTRIGNGGLTGARIAGLAFLGP